jgi:triphosphatase
VNDPTEIELKFLVPRSARAGVVAALAHPSAATGRTSLMALYLDTEDRRLARAGMAWRLRREGRRWVQTLKAERSNALERFEHEVVRPDASPDPALHAGTPAGDRLIALLRKAKADGFEPSVRFRSLVRRTTRRIRTRGAWVEVAFDEGRLVSADASQPIREIEFELVSGSPVALIGLAERWRKRFGLIYDPRSKSLRGDRLAEGFEHPPLRKANPPRYDDDATATEAFAAVLDECLAQITHNAIGLIEGAAEQRVEHVHQLRVGIRRLRSALRRFRRWVAAPPDELVDGLRALFATLGMARDSDVLQSGVMAELAKAGAPALRLPAGPVGPDPIDAVRAAVTQRLLLAWIAWRTALPAASASPAATEAQAAAANAAQRTAADDPRAWQHDAGRRLRRWHARLVADAKAFDEFDDAELHALRKRIKRQRYAVEFFAPLLRRRRVERYLVALTTVQERMGTLNDLLVARQRYQALGTPDPAAWFALGWLAARVAEQRALAKPELQRLAKAEPPAP